MHSRCLFYKGTATISEHHRGPALFRSRSLIDNVLHLGFLQMNFN